MKLKVFFIFLLLIVILSFQVNGLEAFLSDAENNSIILQYNSGIALSYFDDELNPNIRVTVISERENLLGKYVCLVYKVGNTFIEISEGPSSATFCEPLILREDLVGKYRYTTSLSIKTGDFESPYPAIIYAALSDDKKITIDDTFIKINPEKSWLLGADGGPPCTGAGDLWILEPEGCNIEDTADQKYDSYDIKKTVEGNQVKIKVLAAYFPVSEKVVKEIPIDADFLVVGLITPNNQVLDAKLTSPYYPTRGPDENDEDDEITLSAGKYSGPADIVINGIKTDEVIIGKSEEAPTSSDGKGEIGSEESIWIGGRELFYVFDFLLDNVESLEKVTIYVKQPLQKADFKALLAKSQPFPGLYFESISPRSSISNDNIALVILHYKVPRTWVEASFLDPSDIGVTFILEKNLFTVQSLLERSDDIYYYYSAILPTLTTFSFGGKGGTLFQVPDDVLVAAISQRSQEPYPVQEPFPIFPLMILISFLLIILVLLWRRRRRK